MKTQLLSTLANSRAYTLAVADAMPAAGYDFKPVEGVWNFGELMHHIAYGIHWWEQQYISGKETEWAPPAPVNGKAKLKAELEKAYDTLEKSLQRNGLSEAAVSGFHNTLHHIAHHRGQAVTYLRCRDVAAPEYAY